MSSRKQWQQQFTRSVVSSKYHCDPLRPFISSFRLSHSFCCIPSVYSLSAAFSLSLCLSAQHFVAQGFRANTPHRKLLWVGVRLHVKRKIVKESKVICFIAGSGQACLMTFKTVELESRECVNSQTRERYLCGSWNKCIQAVDLTCQAVTAVSYCSLTILNAV